MPRPAVMRRAAALASAALVVVVAVPGGAPAARTKSLTCGAPAITVLLWPHGHKAIQSVHFPAKRTPNIQIYRIDPRYAGGNFLLYADVKGNVHTAPGYCGKTGKQTAGAIAQPQTLKGKRAVTCIVTATQAFDVSRTASGMRIRGREGSLTLWTASVTRGRRAKITFDSSVCSVTAGPS